MRRPALAFAFFAALFALALTACTTLDALVGNQVTFTAPQLQKYVDRQFPRDYQKLGGLVTLRVMHPRLTIPQDSNRLQLDFDLGIGGFGMDSQAVAGRFALQSGLRFDPTTRGLHLVDPQLMNVDMPSLGGAMNAPTRAALNSWLSDYARQEPVYRLDDNAWGRLAGRRIGGTTIGDGKVVLHLDQ
ncbi:hypothetical protein LF41_1931 [Lysobacter dokdonensis DS-58]|uniref:DUF1439 domain-containing protein n=1 Tax=Lysobacter dokdonensis DS-58 TaxID=1300345 RepID=A0A0A2WXL3_9GAMM|nr:DUF1439 domain-containing protein [Lysobacter dokdonensis]KGQ17724.1 hypothetical protein LF41_1931 [Lysobacter dokdonensis DS-58]